MQTTAHACSANWPAAPRTAGNYSRLSRLTNLGLWSAKASNPAVTCAADLDGDGTLTLFDFLAFQNLFDAGDTLADFDDDGTLTIFDFLAFQNAFDAGC